MATRRVKGEQAPGKSKKGGTAVAAVIPLALALVHSAIVPGSDASKAISTGAPVICDEVPKSFRECHSKYPHGCNLSGNYDWYTNLLKNKVEWPSDKVVKFLTAADYPALEKELPAKLTSRNHASFQQDLATHGEGKLYGLVGYLYRAKIEGEESTNCEVDSSDEDVDFHIFIGFNAKLAKKIQSHEKLDAREKEEVRKESIVVEMSPHYRDAYHPNDWTFDALKQNFGKQVRIMGQLMVDNDHNIKSQNCGHLDQDGHPDATDSCWRKSVWELHPVTSFEICSDKSTCTENSGEWTELKAQIDSAGTLGTKTGAKNKVK